MFTTGINEWKYTKTYKTVANLEAALIKLGLNEIGSKILVASPIDGRFICVFGKAWLDAAGVSIVFVVNAGFKVIN